MKHKPITPYQRLLDVMREAWNEVQYAHRVEMWFWPKDKLTANWRLDTLAERVEAANQIGYDVILENTSSGLSVFYRKRPPGRPFPLL